MYKKEQLLQDKLLLVLGSIFLAYFPTLQKNQGQWSISWKFFIFFPLLAFVLIKGYKYFYKEELSSDIRRLVEIFFLLCTICIFLPLRPIALRNLLIVPYVLIILGFIFVTSRNFLKIEYLKKIFSTSFANACEFFAYPYELYIKSEEQSLYISLENTNLDKLTLKQQERITEQILSALKEEGKNSNMILDLSLSQGGTKNLQPFIERLFAKFKHGQVIPSRSS